MNWTPVQHCVYLRARVYTCYKFFGSEAPGDLALVHVASRRPWWGATAYFISLHSCTHTHMYGILYMYYFTSAICFCSCVCCIIVCQRAGHETYGLYCCCCWISTKHIAGLHVCSRLVVRLSLFVYIERLIYWSIFHPKQYRENFTVFFALVYTYVVCLTAPTDILLARIYT